MNLYLNNDQVQKTLVNDRLDQFRRDAQVERMVRDGKQVSTPRGFRLIDLVKRLAAGRAQRPVAGDQPLVGQAIHE